MNTNNVDKSDMEEAIYSDKSLTNEGMENNISKISLNREGEVSLKINIASEI